MTRAAARGRALAAALAVELAAAAGAGATDGRLEFTLHKNEAPVAGHTVLVVGGIQGDEPGGFNAASLLVTHYALTSGAVWVVPNLNFESIVRRSRGVHGDMNRKFSQVSRDDPDYADVEKIKRIIRDDAVDYVFNLHDGSGFYRHEHVDGDHSPRRWGQSIIIDQERVGIEPFGRLGDLARTVADNVNGALEDDEHRYHVKNTRTREGDVEMEKTLTFFAINNGKPAVGVEASKSLPTHLRVYYHLQVLEAYMRRLGIGFERRFPLTPLAVKDTVDNNVQVSFYDNRIYFDMARARSRLGYVPLKKDAGIEYTASSPLVAITGSGKGYRVSYGNRRVTELHLQRFEYDASLEAIALEIDGRVAHARFGSVVEAEDWFRVIPIDGYRVNVIGWTRRGVDNESGQLIERARIADRFSVDREATVFRVEVYHEGKFSGMVLVRFRGAAGKGLS